MSTVQDRIKVARWASISLVTGALGVASTVVVGLGALMLWPAILGLDLAAIAFGAMAMAKCERASDRRIGAVGLALGVVGGAAIALLAVATESGFNS